MPYLLAFLILCSTAPAKPAAVTKGEIVIAPATEDWVSLPSKAFFRKPTTLLENRSLARLRGIVSERASFLKKGETFSERQRLIDACKNIPQSYSATEGHSVAKARVYTREIPHCRIRVRDKDGLIIEQILFVSEVKAKKGGYLTQTITFFYPEKDSDRASLEVTKFIKSVSRRSHG